MKRHLGFLAACCLAFTNAPAAPGSSIFLNSGASGAMELSNLAGEQDGELLIAAPEHPAPVASAAPPPPPAYAPSPAPATAPTPGSGRRAETSKATAAADDLGLSPNEQYRNRIQQQLQGSLRNAANPAVSRRYLMHSRPPMAAFGR